MATWDAVVLTTYDGRQAIFCRCCGSLSWNPHDVEHQFCGRCNVFGGQGQHQRCARTEVRSEQDG